MKILGFIPARANSKGIPNKNAVELNGKPLITYTIEAALASSVDKVIVSTDSEVIAGIAEAHGAEAPFLRPAEMAEDDSIIEDAITHCLGYLNNNQN
jgi:CMP-N-acetylneuraminic acid synthetase